MKRRLSALRWRIAGALNRLPWTCWCDLVDWAGDHYPKDERPPLLFTNEVGTGVATNRAWSCRQEASTNRHGICYCAKFRTQQAQDEAGDNLAPGWVVPDRRVS